MALFDKKPKVEQPDSYPGAREIGISMRCDVCGASVPKATYVPSLSALICVCENSHKTVIEGFGLDLV